MIKKQEEIKKSGVALILAKELNENLYLDDSMVFDHSKFRNQYEKIPDDYPDAFTINKAKIMEEKRLIDFFSETREVDNLIKNIVNNNTIAKTEVNQDQQVCHISAAANFNYLRLEYEDPILWDVQVDVLKRRISKLRMLSELKRGSGHTCMRRQSCAICDIYPGHITAQNRKLGRRN